mmetsp:Transcript_6498/g.16117  ORF Transcript_6498/g.16117 Transcript_6498/m.16117 type:complete len:254 (+) Transcript_6498:1117-1878(+)
MLELLGVPVLGGLPAGQREVEATQGQAQGRDDAQHDHSGEPDEIHGVAIDLGECHSWVLGPLDEDRLFWHYEAVGLCGRCDGQLVCRYDRYVHPANIEDGQPAMCRVAPRVAALEGATFLATVLAHGPEARGLLHVELHACGMELLTAYNRSHAPQVARPVAQAPAGVDIAVLRKPDVPGVPVPVRQVRRQDVGVEWAPAVDIIREQVLLAVVKAQVKAQTSGDQAGECQHLPGAPNGKQPEANDYNACECRR